MAGNIGNSPSPRAALAFQALRRCATDLAAADARGVSTGDASEEARQHNVNACERALADAAVRYAFAIHRAADTRRAPRRRR